MPAAAGRFAEGVCGGSGAMGATGGASGAKPRLSSPDTRRSAAASAGVAGKSAPRVGVGVGGRIDENGTGEARAARAALAALEPRIWRRVSDRGVIGL